MAYLCEVKNYKINYNTNLKKTGKKFCPRPVAKEEKNASVVDLQKVEMIINT